MIVEVKAFDTGKKVKPFKFRLIKNNSPVKVSN
jgi:hypothetical protein